MHSARQLLARIVAVVLFSTALGIARPGKANGSDGVLRSDALDRLFSSIDKDGNGQIEAMEASQYIDENFEERDLFMDSAKAAEQMSSSLDGSDSDATVSKAEVERHLRKLLKGNRLADWLRNSLQMPQYVNSFRENSITSLDFPSLLADDGKLLESELGVKSKLHREQIMRAMRRIVLGIGRPPSIPEGFRAKATQCNAVSLSWDSPINLGQPPLHKFKLERLRTADSAAPASGISWETVSDQLDDETHSHVDHEVEAALYTYRLTAWNVVGWSTPALSAECSTLNSSLPCPPGSCWRQGTCGRSSRAATKVLLSHESQGFGLGGWRLACSLLGVLLLGYSIVVYSIGKDFLWELASGLGLSSLIQASPAVAYSTPFAAPPEDANVRPGISAMDQRLRQSEAARSFSDQLALQRPLRVSNDHCRSCSTLNLGLRKASPQQRKGMRPASRSDFFSADQLNNYRGLTPQASKNASSTVGANSSQSPLQAASSAQQVLWLNDEGEEVEAPPVLDIPPSPKETGRHGCAFPGCEKGLHPLFHPRSAMTSHYCSICQSVFCHRHTRYSPHGKLGSCGMESKCICSLCFDDLPRITQERLERTNKLQQRPRREVAVQSSGGSASSKELDTARRRTSSAKYGSSQSLASMADSPTGRSERQSTSSLSLEKGSSPHWSKLRTAWRAVLLFQGAGSDHRRRSEQGLPPLQPSERPVRKTQ